MVLSHYYSLMEVWHGNESLKFMEIHRRWREQNLTSQKTTSQTAEQLRRLVRDGFVTKKGKNYKSNFDFERFNQSRMIHELKIKQGETYFYDAAIPAPYSLDGKHISLEIMPWLDAKNSDEIFVQSLLIRLIIRTFEMVRLLNFIKKLRILGINASMPDILLNYSTFVTPFLDDCLLYLHDPKDIFNLCWPEGNTIYKEKLDLAVQSNENRQSIEILLPYLRHLLPFNESESKEFVNSHKLTMLNRSPERANNDLRIINEMKRTLDAKKEANKADDFQDICTALAVDIVEIVKKEKSTDDLALTCTTHPRDIKLLSPQMQSFIESIKNERNLCILMKLYFPEKSFIERLPLLMSLYHLRSEEIEALKIFLKNDVSLSEREIKNIVQRFNILQRKYYNSHDVMPPS